jgi:uncharacterized protein YutE (UPF0331/DUF86 family)
MVEGKINKKVVIDRISWIKRMLELISALPLDKRENFLSDHRNIASAESYLRRALEALFDLSRHILVKEFGVPAVEYKEVARLLAEKKVISQKECELLLRMAGYRSRMAHFYHEISPDELYEICKEHLDEIETVLDGVVRWLKEKGI